MEEQGDLPIDRRVCDTFKLGRVVLSGLSFPEAKSLIEKAGEPTTHWFGSDTLYGFLAKYQRVYGG